MTDYTISSGKTKRYDLMSGDTLTVLSNGLSSGSVVSGGAYEYLSAGGGSLNDNILSGGRLIDAGYCQFDDFLSGSQISIISGGDAENNTIENGSQEYISAGGSSSDDVHGKITVYQGAFDAGGIDTDGLGIFYGNGSGVAVVDGGILDVMSGGSLNDSHNDGGFINALPGSELSSVSVSNDGPSDYGLISIDYGAIASSVTVDSGSYAIVAGTVSSGQGYTAEAWRAVSATTFDGVTLSKAANLTLDNTHVESGGVLMLAAGAIADGLVISAGGQLLGPGELASSLYQEPGETPLGVTSDYGLISGVSVGGSNNLYSDGTAELDVFSGGSAQGVTISAGSLVVGAYGATTGTVVSGGMEVVSGFGLATGTTVLAGGVQLVEGGVASNTVVASGGLLSGDVARAKTKSATVLDGGVESVLSGAAAIDTTVSSGGVLLVGSGGVATGDRVLAGGLVSGVGNVKGAVTDFGSAVDLRLAAAGRLNVGSGGVAEDVRITSGGTLALSTGGEADDPTLLAGADTIDGGLIRFNDATPVTVAGVLTGGGKLEVDGAGALTAGTLTLSADATGYKGQLTLNAGTVDLAGPAGLGTGSVLFGAGGASETLKVEAPGVPASGGAFASELFDFDSTAKVLDLRGLAFTSGATATLSKTVLTLTDGAYTATFKLGGATAGAYTVTADASGVGTSIHATTTSADAIVQAIAGFGAEAAGADPSHFPAPPNSQRGLALAAEFGRKLQALA